MLIEIKLKNHTVDNDIHAPSASVTYTVVSDVLSDGPLDISMQGIAPRLADDNGEVLGWMSPGSYYRYGSTTDQRLIAGKIEVSDPVRLNTASELVFQFGEGGISLQPNENPEERIQWTVKQTFSERPAYTIECRHEHEETRFLYDQISGNPVVNSAGDFFPSEPKMKIPILVFEISRREFNNPIARSRTYINAVNADYWCGAAPGSFLMDSILPKWNGNYWEVKYVLKFKAQGWGEKYLDEGLREIKDGKIMPILDRSSGTMMTNSVKLDGQGRLPVERNPNGSPVLDDEGKEKPLTNFPGVQYPQGNNNYWKYKMLHFLDLGLPDVTVPVSKVTL